jgi:LysM repeat protein
MTDEREKDDDEYEDETSESEEEYEDEVEGAEASGESAGEESADSVASWGYEEKKRRFSKEMLAGFAVVGLLLTIFGVVVYKKFPGASDSAEVVKAGPDVSLNNPEGVAPENDPNDPFAAGVGDNLGTQTEPGTGEGNSGELFIGENSGGLNAQSGTPTTFEPGGSGAETASMFPDPVLSGQSGSNDPFASNSETPDLFAGQSEPGSATESADLFAAAPRTDQFGRPLAGNASGAIDQGQTTTLKNPTKPTDVDRRNVFGSGQSEFADSGRADPFSTPGLAGKSTDSTTSSLDPLGSYQNPDAGNSFDNPSRKTEAGSGLVIGEPAGIGSSGAGSADPFSPGNQFAQNGPKAGGTSASSTRNDPFATTPADKVSNDPFGSPAETGSSRPGGLFDRKPKKPQAEIDFGGSEPSSTGITSGVVDKGRKEPGNLLGSGSSVTGSPGKPTDPFGSNEPFGTLDSGSSDKTSASPASGSPVISNDPFGSQTGTASNDLFSNPTSGSAPASNTGNSFDNGRNEPANLFPESNTGRSTVGTASNDPFQSPLTSTSDSSFPSASSPANSSNPFGSERLKAATSAETATFASKPAKSRGEDKPGTYTVQEGDTYWNISKKVYGTAKYFQVLADHNLNTIADPQKMKAGTVVQTPDAGVLQRKLTTVVRAAPTGLTGRIETSGRADGAGSSSSNGLEKSADGTVTASRQPTSGTEPSGILFNEQGYPLFRIGETDTLTSIASDHLGRSSRWEQVYNMNRDQLQSPDKLQIGMLLKLPADASRVPLIDRTSSLR